MNKEQLKALKKKGIIMGIPTVIKFKKINSDFSKFKATKGVLVVKWSDVLKINKYKKFDVVTNVTKSNGGKTKCHGKLRE